MMEREGVGKEYSAFGNLVYEGSFVKGLYSGKGTLYYKESFPVWNFFIFLKLFFIFYYFLFFF